MRTSVPFRLAFAAVVLAPLAAAQSFEFTFDPQSSTTSLAASSRLELPGSAIGSFDPNANPTGTITCTNLFGACDNEAFDMDLAVLADSAFAGAPTGRLNASFDLENGLMLVSGFDAAPLGAAAGGAELTLELVYETFRTQQPNALFLGGFTLPIPLGQAAVTELRITQVGGPAVGLVTLANAPGVWQFAVLVPAELEFDLDLLGTPSHVGPIPFPLPLTGTFEPLASPARLSLAVDESLQQTIPDPLPGQTFDDVPLDVPTVLPPGQIAHLLLDLAVGELAFDSTTHLAWTALGTPVCEATSYCVSLPNTFSTGAQIGALGSSSVALDDLELVAQGVPPLHAARFAIGSRQGFAPFGDGYLCLGGLVRRFPIRFASGAGTVVQPVDYLDPAQPGSLVTPGSTWNFQLFFRDPLGGPLTFNSTDAISITFCP
jgi:hypothetical protein